MERMLLRRNLILTLCAASLLLGQSTDYDKKLGAEAAEEVLRTRGLYDDPKLTHFFEKLGMRLVSGLGAQPSAYRFAVANSEAKLAGVIGHEIIRTHKRHAIQAAKRPILPAIFAAPGSLGGLQ